MDFMIIVQIIPVRVLYKKYFELNKLLDKFNKNSIKFYKKECP